MTRLLRDRRALLLVAGVATIGVACASPPASTPPPPPDYAAELGPVADAFIDVWNTKEYARLDDILSPEFRRRAPDADAEGLDGMKEFMRQAHETYADFHIVVEESACNRDACFLLWTVTGKVMGEGDDPGVAGTLQVSPDLLG